MIKQNLSKIIIASLISPLLFVQPVQAQTIKLAEERSLIEVKKQDPRAKILEDYLNEQKSPLAPHAGDFIEAADEYGLDWKLVVSIAGLESSYGKRTPGSIIRPSYNGWGWGVYGNQALYFDSWRAGIFTVSQGLREKYVNRGLDTPAKMNRIYAASPTWGVRVAYLMNKLEAYSKEYPTFAAPDDLILPENRAAKSSISSAKLSLSR